MLGEQAVRRGFQRLENQVYAPDLKFRLDKIIPPPPIFSLLVNNGRHVRY